MRISPVSLAIIWTLSSFFSSAVRSAHAFPRKSAATTKATAAAVCPYRKLFSVMMMSRKMVALPDFLSESKEHPSSHIVIGNEAGDADSIISAIGLAYVESVGLSTSRANHHWKTPIISIPRNDLESQRPETTLLFKLAAIDNPVDKLIFANEIDTILPERCDVTLVDHNRLADRFQNSSWTVVEIVDHHKDLGYYTDTCFGDARTIAFEKQSALVASTCTLVVERLVEYLKPPFPTPLSTILLGTILLDSVNMNPAAGKGTKRDETAIQLLLEHTDWTFLEADVQELLQVDLNNDDKKKTPNTTALFEALQNAKFDLNFWKSLSVRDALRLDYKEFSPNENTVNFGVSTVLMPLRDFAREGLRKDVLKYMNESEIPFLGIMFAYQENDTMQRQLTLCSIESFPLEDVVSFLLEHNLLGLVELQGLDHGGQMLKMQSFQQTNVKASRKQVAPLLMEYFEQPDSNEL